MSEETKAKIERLLRDVLKTTTNCQVDTHVRAALFWLDQCATDITEAAKDHG